ncbi:MAG: hypothetical protein ACI9S8_002596 [Chlamydiales bacterium]|jgi:hypothetical protein
MEVFSHKSFLIDIDDCAICLAKMMEVSLPKLSRNLEALNLFPPPNSY